jgi:hypothetical protein
MTVSLTSGRPILGERRQPVDADDLANDAHCCDRQVGKPFGFLQVLAKLEIDDIAHLINGQVVAIHLFMQPSNNLEIRNGDGRRRRLVAEEKIGLRHPQDTREVHKVSYRNDVEGFAVVELEIPVHRGWLVPTFCDFSLAQAKRFTSARESLCHRRELCLFTIVLVGGRKGAFGQFTLFRKAHDHPPRCRSIRPTNLLDAITEVTSQEHPQGDSVRITNTRGNLIHTLVAGLQQMHRAFDTQTLELGQG